MSKSEVSGILDAKGGLRVVITQRWRMRYHVKKGERLFMLPDLSVQEPVAGQPLYDLIERVKTHVAGASK